MSSAALISALRMISTVNGSTLRFISSLLPGEDQVAVVIYPQVLLRQDEGGGHVFLDDGWAVEGVARQQFGAVVDVERAPRAAVIDLPALFQRCRRGRGLAAANPGQAGAGALPDG